MSMTDPAPTGTATAVTPPPPPPRIPVLVDSSDLDQLRADVAHVVSEATADILAQVRGEVARVRSDVPKAAQPSISAALALVAHPGTNTGLGLALAALSAFTAAVPANLRGGTTIAGLGYALATVVVDWLKSRTPAA